MKVTKFNLYCLYLKSLGFCATSLCHTLYIAVLFMAVGFACDRLLCRRKLNWA